MFDQQFFRLAFAVRFPLFCWGECGNNRTIRLLARKSCRWSKSGSRTTHSRKQDNSWTPPQNPRQECSNARYERNREPFRSRPIGWLLVSTRASFIPLGPERARRNGWHRNS